MVGSIVHSAFGPLPMHNDDYPDSHTRKLPSLQFDDFDLVIKLDKDPNLWLLVHAEIFRKTCAILGRSFSGDWENLTSSAPEVINHSRTGESRKVRTRALNHVDRTWLIEGRGIPEDRHQRASLFCQSELAPPGWSRIVDYNYKPIHDTKRSLRLFVALLHGAKIECEHLCGVDKAHKVSADMINLEILPLLANVCAYAEYFGCWTADKVTPILTSSSAHGEAIALEPKKHCLFAKKLEHADLYQDALRHMIAQTCLYGWWWPDIAEITGWEENQIRVDNALRITLQTVRAGCLQLV